MKCEKCDEPIDANMSKICVSQEQLAQIKAALMDDPNFMRALASAVMDTSVGCATAHEWVEGNSILRVDEKYLTALWDTPIPTLDTVKVKDG
jgi:hypothetical protein